MKIYVDADACPVKEQVYRVAARHGVPVVVAANSSLRVPSRDDIEAVHVPGGFEAVDDWIAEQASAGDVVATADLLLAARVVDRGAVCIDFRGKEFTADALGGLLASREIARRLRESGSYGGGPPPLSPRDRGHFAGKLDEVLHRLRRASRLPKESSRVTDSAQPASPNPWLATRRSGGDDYDVPYERRAAAGENVHGEADFVESLGVRAVLDAGCGTGRVARELARRGLEVLGVDLDPGMLSTARRKGPHLAWHLADLAQLDLGREFDAVVAAGNVMIFLTPGTEPTVLHNFARHLRPGGLLVAGFQLTSGRLNLADYDRLAADAGLRLSQRFATWDRQLWRPGADYAVSVHQR